MEMPHEKEELHDNLITQLSQELPGCQIQDIRAFVRHALYAHADTTFETIIRNFLGKGVHAGKVLATLLRCEWSNIHWLLIDSRQRDLSDQVAAFSDCVNHYNTLQAIIVEEAETVWERSLESEKKARILAESKVKWFNDHHVELHHYFEEIPVRAKLELLDAIDDDIDLVFSADAGMVFAASDDLRTAYISVGACMRLTVRGVKRQGNRLRLAITGIEADFMSRRNDVRVAMDKIIPITLHGKKDIRAHIYDKSAQGLGVRFSEDLGVKLLSTGEIKTGDRIICRWQAGEYELKAPATIRWIRKVEGLYRAGLEIKPDEATRIRLQQFLMQYQRKIIARLRSLGLPAWMKQ